MERLIRMSELTRIVGLSRSEIYRRMALTPPKFPRSVALGPRARAWKSGKVEEFIQACDAAPRTVTP
jgi:predicted DNA-binding transcriptional regulator AlpA